MRQLQLDELNRLSPEEFRAAPKTPVCMVLDNVRSMHNVGSVFRCADAFGIEKIWLCGYTPCPPHRDIRKVAIGAEDSVDWGYEQEITILLKQLKSEGWKIIAIEQTDASLPLPEFSRGKDEKVALVMGNEVKGVSEEALACCDLALEIPQFGTKHSLNISVAAGIVIYHVALLVG
ncbi:MAG: RNA methyltransferase [Bacteroidia bacterium]|nr:RNA methyltransferase [Bacteroidia bacterium]